MKNNYSKKFPAGAVACFIRGSLAALAVLTFSGMVHAQEKIQDNNERANFSTIPSPTTTIPPPSGNSAFLLGHGVGTQGYVCLPTATGASWTVNNARREQELPQCEGVVPVLQVIGSDEGPAGGRLLTNTTFIQRLNTNGGSAPATGCLVTGDVGKQVLVPYSADYYFFRNDQ